MSMSYSASDAGEALRSPAGVFSRARTRMETIADGWLIGLAARLVFAAVLLPYYFNSALTKIGDGLLGIFPPSAGAFAQILPPIAEQYSYDVAAIPFFPWHIVVIAGTISEFILPLLVSAGLLTRLSALALIGFVAVQTFVDIAFHGAGAGALFNTQPGDLLDTRLLWIFPLALLAMKGAGAVSLDALLFRRR